jgi:hypothetical protein
MSSTRLLSTNNEANSLLENGVIIKDIVPHSISNDDNCLCTCSSCPNVFNWCVKDALGLLCSILTWFLFIYGEFVIVFVILIPKNYSIEFNMINLFIFHFLEFLSISSHFRTMFSNPVCIYYKNPMINLLLNI